MPINAFVCAATNGFLNDSTNMFSSTCTSIWTP
jgi:hypothetical protein